MLKRIAKRLFPAPFLKAAFAVYNKIRISTVDRILFPEYKIHPGKFAILRNGYPFREENISIDDLPDGQVKHYMEQWYTWTQEEFLLQLDRPCWIEPQFGWAIVPPNGLVYYSLGVSRTWFQPKPALRWYVKRTPVKKISQAISLRDTGEENYFHFYNDVLSKLYFLMEKGVDLHGPSIIVSERLWDKPYFQYAHAHTPLLQSLQWVRQGDEYLQCDSVIFCKPLTHKKSLWDAIVSPLRLNGPAPGEERVFITRSKGRLRFIENIDAVEALCRAHGVTILDTDQLTADQQISVFSSVKYLIGIHGAGLTNMVFSQRKCSVLEIFPPPDLGYLPYHYVLLAKLMGFKYNAIIGNKGSTRFSGGFRVDTTALDGAMKQLFAG